MRTIMFSIVLCILILAGNAESQEPIDKFVMKDQGKWSCAKTIAIRPFEVTDEFKGKKGPEFYQDDFANKLAAGLRKIAGIERVDIVDIKSIPNVDILIEGKFIDLTTGSRALRFWVSFGAGKSFCRVDMKGIDPKSGMEVFTLDHARGSAMDFVNDDELIENIDEVVEDVSAGLQNARRECVSGSSEGK
jgi:hypothetical protein